MQNILDDDFEKEHVRQGDEYNKERLSSLTELVTEIPFQKRQEQESFEHNFLTHAQKAHRLGITVDRENNPFLEPVKDS